MPRKPLELEIKESEVDFIKIREKYLGRLKHVDKKIQLLRLLKSDSHFSKRRLGQHLSLNANTIQKWRLLYKEGGIDKLLGINKITPTEKQLLAEANLAISMKLRHIRNGGITFIEMHTWVREHYLPEIKYNTFYRYINRNFKAEINKFKKQRKKIKGQD